MVDQIDEPENPDTDFPVRTLGGVLEIYSALPPNSPPLEIDRSHLEEVKTIIDHLVMFSDENDVEIECELDGIHIGTIDNGEADEGITMGLLGEWEKVLSSRNA